MNRILRSALLSVCIISLFPISAYSQEPDSDISVGATVYSCAYDGYVNIHTEASLSSASIGKFYNGNKATVVELQGEKWVKVYVYGNVGWVLAKYVQTEPTIVYTGSVDADWVQGVWSCSGYYLRVFNNGTFEWGSAYAQAHGKYLMQDNSIRFITTWVEAEKEPFDQILEIREDENMLGDYSRVDYISESDELAGRGDFGHISEESAKRIRRSLLSQVDQEKPIVSAVKIAENTDPAADEESSEETEVAEEAEAGETEAAEKDGFFKKHDKLIIDISLILILLLTFFVIYKIAKKNKSQAATQAATTVIEEAQRKEELPEPKPEKPAVKTAEEKAVKKVEKKTAKKDGRKNERAKFRMTLSYWILIAGLYLFLFLDYVLGIITIAASVVLIIIEIIGSKKSDNNQSFVEDLVNRINPITKRVFLCFLVGAALYWTINWSFGGLLCILAVVFYVVWKIAPAFAEKIDDNLEASLYSKGRALWTKTWYKILCLAVLVVLPFLSAQNNVLSTILNDGSGYENSSGSSDYGRSSSRDNTDYSWIEGYWHQRSTGYTGAPMTIIIKFMPDDDSRFGQFLMGATSSNELMPGSYSISDGQIRLVYEGGLVSYLTIVGKRLKDDGGYWSR